MTFILHPLSHYNTIIEPCAQFLLSLIKGLTIDFPSHFILSHIDIYKDTATHDKLIFPSAITILLCHFSVSYPESPHFSFMCAIDAATFSGVLLQPQSQTVTPPASTAPSISVPSSLVGGVTLKAIMA